MIEETLLKSNYLGKDGFIWWIGQVAPPEVWDIPNKVDIDYTKYGKSWAYRCKVRIIGYHTFDRKELPDKDLPWAHIMLTATDGNAQAGMGKSHKIVGGETVFGFFLDGDDAQQPVIIGSIYRNSNVENFDIDEIAFKPFSGHQNGGRINQGYTKQQQVVGKQQNPSETSGSEDIISGPMKEPTTLDLENSPTRSGDKFGPIDRALDLAYKKAESVTLVSENGCDNNIIGKITRAIQNFIAIVNGLESYLDTFVDPLLNSFVDIVTEIRRTATIIVGSIKGLINNMRNIVMKIIGCLFSKFVNLVVPIPQQTQIGEAAKNIINIIFCLFEKIIDKLIPFLENLLQGLVGRALNAPLCAIEEFTATILNKVLDIIDELLEPVLSGLNWLMGGLSQVRNILSKATSIANTIFSLIGCDGLKCETPSEWALNLGPSKSEYDNWDRVTKKMNIIRGFNDSMELAANSLSIYGNGSSSFRDCSDRIKNPQTQSDLIDSNYGKINQKCIPPEVNIYGDGVGAQVVPVIGQNGSILSLEILSSGFGYSKPPTITIIDKSNYGFGAKVGASVKGGKIDKVYLINPGSGYCETNLSNIIKTPFYIVTADKYTFYEGETCNFTIVTENVSDGTELYYSIGGQVRASDIEGPTSGKVIIFNNRATVSVKTRQDSVGEQVEQLIFDVLNSSEDVVARAIVLINDILSPILQVSPPFSSQSPVGSTLPDNFGNVDLISGGISTYFAPSILPPFTGVLPNVPSPSIGSSAIVDINIPTIPPIIGGGTTITTPGTGGGDNSGIIVDVIILNPGIGYTPGDRIIAGDCPIVPIVSPNGSIVGIQSVTCSSEFNTLPELIIDSNTGQGAVIYPILRYVPKTNTVPGIAINEVGVLKIVDCI